MRAATDPRIRGLYVLTPETADTALLAEKTASAIAGGALAVQYRSKTAAPELRVAQAQALAALCAGHGVALIVNDDPALAVAVNAAGVHIGSEDLPLPQAREIVGAHRIVGVSCYNDLSLAERAVAGGADYIAFGSFFPSPTKPQAVRADVTLIHRARARWRTPIVAIGGITADNVASLVAAGVDAVAVLSAVYDAEDVEAAACAIAGKFKRAQEERA